MSQYFLNIFKKIKQPFQQGLTRYAIAKAIIVGLLISVFPVFGTTTVLLTIISVKFKLNLPVMIVVSYLATPLQFMLFLPFIRVGETIFNTKHTLLTIQEIKAAFEVSFIDAVGRLIFELICGISGWLLIALPISILTILLINKIFKLMENHK